LEFICHLFIVIRNLCQKKQQFKKCDTMEDLIVKRRETANEAASSKLASQKKPLPAGMPAADELTLSYKKTNLI
jgi:hypothetical protein